MHFEIDRSCTCWRPGARRPSMPLLLGAFSIANARFPRFLPHVIDVLLRCCMFPQACAPTCRLLTLERLQAGARFCTTRRCYSHLNQFTTPLGQESAYTCPRRLGLSPLPFPPPFSAGWPPDGSSGVRRLPPCCPAPAAAGHRACGCPAQPAGRMGTPQEWATPEAPREQGAPAEACPGACTREGGAPTAVACSSSAFLQMAFATPPTLSSASSTTTCTLAVTPASCTVRSVCAEVLGIVAARNCAWRSERTTPAESQADSCWVPAGHLQARLKAVLQEQLGGVPEGRRRRGGVQQPAVEGWPVVHSAADGCRGKAWVNFGW